MRVTELTGEFRNGTAGDFGSDIMINVFNPDTVKTNGTGIDQYQFIDAPHTFNGSATYAPPANHQ
jgi:hypothetical protein